MSNRKIIYYDKEKDVGLSIGYNEFRRKKYVHISINMFDPDTEAWYRTKGLSVTEDYVDFIIEGLEEVSENLAKENLPDVRQLDFGFPKRRKDDR